MFQKCLNKLKLKGKGKITISINFEHKKLMLSNATNQKKSTVELSYMCPRGLTGPPTVTNIAQIAMTICYDIIQFPNRGWTLVDDGKHTM